MLWFLNVALSVSLHPFIFFNHGGHCSPLRTNMASWMGRQSRGTNLVYNLKLSLFLPSYALHFTASHVISCMFAFRRSIMRQIEMNFQLQKIFYLQLCVATILGQGLMTFGILRNGPSFSSSLSLSNSSHFSGSWIYCNCTLERRMVRTWAWQREKILQKQEGEKEREKTSLFCKDTYC